jgi:hypothetical protein
MLVAMLASQGLEPPSMDAWSGWRTFKHFVRVVDEVPDPGVSVQIVKHDDATTRLFFVRQVLEPRDDKGSNQSAASSSNSHSKIPLVKRQPRSICGVSTTRASTNSSIGLNRTRRSHTWPR